MSLRIDAHQHFWQFEPVRDSWIDESMKAIQRDFGPEDLAPILQRNGFDGCVVVQSDQSSAENEFQLQNAASNSIVKGIVGWVDLQDTNVEARLEEYSHYKAMKGFRHVLQGEVDRALMLKPAFMNGISLLKKFGYTYDILIFTDQLKYALELVKAFPGQSFVIDHIAKPLIKQQEIEQWRNDIQMFKPYDNCYCKISGIVTEADWTQWKESDFHPYIDTIVDTFGVNRIMYGSDWPVCEVAGGYDRMYSIVANYFSSFTSNEQALFFGGNAVAFYHLD